ncbi:uncharacterized protein DUF3617 [Plasticicumulans lactativorans]|uniref:Uncharacterized protein DUF3617 n=1 Tax=Plasticicumulans lactativorans TaxID=1133106 RepID=A0A4R2L876_9GAMM|nr:DUF3617 family protein [Plasticicumulans lactativorans]TCO78888.1 uncharacterized protein DUF3617 [Plasticicumulans lactativorans]
MPRHRLMLLALACAAVPALATAADDMPRRKSGLWEVTTQIGGTEGRTMPAIQQCIDAATDDLMRSRGEQMSREMCSKHEMRREGGRIVIDSVCRIGETTSTTRGYFEGDFETAYRGEIAVSYDPPMAGMKASSMTLQARWLGPCQPGQKPGDVIMPGHGGMNLKDMMKHAPAGGTP